MTLKTVSGPTIRQALVEARRQFGESVVLLQSSPPALGEPAKVTVAFDAAPPRAAAPPRSAAAHPDPQPAAAAAPRAYGYGAARNARPPAEPIAAPAPAPTSSEVQDLRDRLAEMEARLADLSAPLVPAPADPGGRRPLVLVGPAGSGKSSVARRLALRPGLVGAARPAVLVVAPDDEDDPDACSALWRAGVPVATVRTAGEVRDALVTFAEADLIVVDTPGLPLVAGRAAPFVERLGRVLAPLADAEVALVVEATRAPSTLTPAVLSALGVRPDGLVLTRLDEAPGGAGWPGHLGLPVRAASAGPDPTDLGDGADVAAPPVEAASPVEAAPPVRTVTVEVLDVEDLDERQGPSAGLWADAAPAFAPVSFDAPDAAPDLAPDPVAPAPSPQAAPPVPALL